MPKPWKVGLVILGLAAIIALIKYRFDGVPPPKDLDSKLPVDHKTNVEPNGSGSAPEPTQVGSSEWLKWFLTLSQSEQLHRLSAIERSMYPVQPNKADWAAVEVKPGPGSRGSDYFPCKVLTNYKPLLQVRQGIGVVGMQFELVRNGDSILSTIWGANAKGAITVDWKNGKVIPAKVNDATPGIGLLPQHVPYGMNVFAGEGELGFGDSQNASIGGVFKWRQNSRAYPLALNRAENLAFGTAFQEKPRKLESIVCVNYTSCRESSRPEPFRTARAV